MSIESVNKFIEKMKNDKAFLEEVLACKNAAARIKLIESKGYKYTIKEIVEEINSDKYRKKIKKNSTEDWKWLEIVGIWSIERRSGWRADIWDRSVRAFLNPKYLKILCPECSQQYYITDSYSGKVLECEVCRREFTVDLSGTPVDNKAKKNINSKDGSEDLTGAIKISKSNTWKNWK